LLATTADIATLETQTKVDQTTLDQEQIPAQGSSYISLDACKAQSFSSGDLYTDLKKAVSTNEDVGRYV
jgi:hypothetical protein